EWLRFLLRRVTQTARLHRLDAFADPPRTTIEERAEKRITQRAVESFDLVSFVGFLIDHRFSTRKYSPCEDCSCRLIEFDRPSECRFPRWPNRGVRRGTREVWSGSTLKDRYATPLDLPSNRSGAPARLSRKETAGNWRSYSDRSRWLSGHDRERTSRLDTCSRAF